MKGCEWFPKRKIYSQIQDLLISLELMSWNCKTLFDDQFAQFYVSDELLADRLGAVYFQETFRELLKPQGVASHFR